MAFFTVYMLLLLLFYLLMMVMMAIAAEDVKSFPTTSLSTLIT